jgi:hypothetical protein
MDTNRKKLSNEEYDNYTSLIAKIPTEFQILDKNPLRDPLQLLNFLSGRNIMMSNLEFKETWNPDNFALEMRNMISGNFLSYCSESANFPGRVNFNVEQLKPFDEQGMIDYLQVKGPLLVLVNGTHLKNHKKGDVLEEVPSDSNYS